MPFRCVFFVGILACHPLAVFAAEPFSELAGDLVEQSSIDTASAPVAVMPFADKTEGAKDSKLGEAVAEELTTALIKRQVRLVERSELRKVLREHELRQSGVISETDAATLGKGLGARLIVVGTVRKSDSGAIRVNARMVQVSDLRAVSAGSITLDNNLVEKYQSPEKRKRRRDTFTLDITGGVSFYELQWTRRYQENITNPAITSFSDQYFVTEEYSAVNMKPSPNAAVRFAYLPVSGPIFASFGFQYIRTSSEATRANLSTSKNVQYQTPSTTNPPSIQLSGSTQWADGAHVVSIFAARPGIFFRLNLSDDLTFFYLGPQLNLMSLNWKNPAGQISKFSWNLDLTLGLRIDFGAIGLILEASAPFLNTYSYADDRQGILQDKSSFNLTGFNTAAGLSFKL